MPFQLNLVPVTELESSTSPDGYRTYATPDGIDYPSVTTVLKRIPNPALDAWRLAMGEERARIISQRAAARGRAIHAVAERYLLNDLNWRPKMPTTRSNFSFIKPILDDHVGIVKGIEIPLYSHALKTAGRSDLVAEYDGIMSIVDFKGSDKEKDEERAHSYFLQATAYSVMFEEMYGIRVPQIVVIIVVEHDHPIVFVKPRFPYLEQVYDVFVGT